MTLFYRYCYQTHSHSLTFATVHQGSSNFFLIFLFHTQINLYFYISTESTQVQAIMDMRGNKPQETDTYIFPIWEKGISATEQMKRIAARIKNTNKYIGRIAETLGINRLPTTYHARHSFATMMLNLGASVEQISESLGHTSISTTQNYLAGFDDASKKNFAQKFANLIK